MLTTVGVAAPATMRSYYNIIDSVPYAIVFISVTYLCCSWKFVPLYPLYLFAHPLLAAASLVLVFISVLFF